MLPQPASATLILGLCKSHRLQTIEGLILTFEDSTKAGQPHEQRLPSIQRVERKSTECHFVLPQDRARVFSIYMISPASLGFRSKKPLRGWPRKATTSFLPPEDVSSSPSCSISCVNRCSCCSLQAVLSICSWAMYGKPWCYSVRSSLLSASRSIKSRGPSGRWTLCVTSPPPVPW